ncbi:MAG: glycosyltransferase [Oscillatoria sp. PMC 1051.18]|nr:glycosyltransferase [Oscillatoria sp. PMC 1050.18]MEC5031954.1 glycosyltransferase [Oscillatoria sp. PMC 1051.18]
MLAGNYYIIPIFLILVLVFWVIFVNKSPKRERETTITEVRDNFRKWSQTWENNEYEGDWLEDITIIVKTFERPCCIFRLLKSIRKYYPTVKILVCEDSRTNLFENQESPQKQIIWLTLPFEAGHTLGAGRNHLLNQVKTPYFFLCDDDHIFTEHTCLKTLLNFLEEFDYDLVGGSQGKEQYGTAIFEQVGEIVYQRFFQYHDVVTKNVVKCDRVSNTFLAKTAAIQTVGWEGRVMANEHAEFFLRASRQGLKIAQMGKIFVEHDRRCEPATGIGKWLGWILPHRDREYHNLMVGSTNWLGTRSQYAKTLQQKYCFEKNGIKKIIDTQSSSDYQKLKSLLTQA